MPEGCPAGRLLVPEALRPEVLQWGHESRLVCHPGIRRTLFAIRQRFWWPTLAADVRQFVLACPTCAQCKPVNRPPDGLLHPLPVPSRPWSHIPLDFVSGLPPSKGNTVILTVVDRFSKVVHFIPLPKLPSARETAQLIRWTTSSGSRDCRLMWFQIGVLSLPPGFGRSFVDRSGPRLVCLLVFILRPMGNASGPTRILKECSAV